MELNPKPHSTEEKTGPERTSHWLEVTISGKVRT